MLCKMIQGKLRIIPFACMFTKVVRFEVLAVVVMKSSSFWDITPCGPLKVDQCFGGTYHLHLQYQRISQARI
jgi:hypothetical protein